MAEHRTAPGAVATASAAHEVLLDASENFWLSSWLKNQIKELQVDGVGRRPWRVSSGLKSEDNLWSILLKPATVSRPSRRRTGNAC